MPGCSAASSVSSASVVCFTARAQHNSCFRRNLAADSYHVVLLRVRLGLRDSALWLLAFLAACTSLLSFNCVSAGAQTISLIGVGKQPASVAVNPVTGKVYVTNYGVSVNNEGGFCLDPGTVTVIDGATKTTTTVTVGLCPTTIAVNPVTNKVYVVNSQDFDLNQGSVTEIDGVTNATATIVVGDTPESIAVNPITNKIYVTNELGASVTVIDGATHATTTLTVGEAPQAVAVDPVTNTIIVACPGYPLDVGYGAVTLIDGATNETRIVITADMGYGAPQLVAVDTVTQRVYLPYNAVSKNGLLVMDEQGNVIQAVPIPDGAVESIAVNPVTNRIYLTANLSPQPALEVFDGEDLDQAPAQISMSGIPSSVTVDQVANKIYATAKYSSDITMVDGNTNVATHLAVPGFPVSVFGATVNTAASTAYFVNSTTVKNHHIATVGFGITSKSIPAGSAPEAIDLNPQTNTIFVANAASNNVTVINGANDTTTSVGTDLNPIAIAANPATNKVYVANAVGNDVTVIDAGNDNATLNVSTGSSPAGIAVNPLTNKVYVANFGNFPNKGNVTVLYASNNNATKTLSPNAYFSTVAVNPATNKIYAGYCNQVFPASSQCSVEVIDGKTDSVIATVAASDGLSLIAVNPVTNKVYIAVNDVMVLDGASNMPIATVSTGDDPHAIVVNTVTNKIYTADFSGSDVTIIDGYTNLTTTVATGQSTCPNGLAVGPTNRIYVADNCANSILLIDGTDNTIKSVAGGSQPFSVAVNPVTGVPYVTNQGGGNVTAIAPEPVQDIPLSTTISPLPNNQTSSPTPMFKFTANSTFSPVAPPPNAVYFQVDTQSRIWSLATATGNGGFTGTVSTLVPGLHTLYAFATNGQESTFSNQGLFASSTSSAVIGNIAGYAFYVTSSGEPTASPYPAMTLSPSHIDYGIVARDQKASRRLLLTNLSSAVLTNIRISLASGTEADNGDFSLDNDCPRSLAPGKHCIVLISLKPEEAGVATASIRVSYGGGTGSPQLVSVMSTIATKRHRR